mmetsp:Transcript_17381/g.24420  ORF Transcript_17381/g.24420 Transcript_17381/m.24420 type:complete len:91 (+) Transcript_17381:14-286(+)
MMQVHRTSIVQCRGLLECVRGSSIKDPGRSPGLVHSSYVPTLEIREYRGNCSDIVSTEYKYDTDLFANLYLFCCAVNELATLHWLNENLW